MAKKIVVAGGNGKLGGRICHYLRARGADVHVLVRDKSRISEVNLNGVTIHEVDYRSTESFLEACRGAHCIVSALSGLRDVIVDAQSRLLEVALLAGVDRFIPSDYCIDYRPLKHGSNRNLDLRREFSTMLDASPIKGTSILNGMFTDLLREDAPVILKKQKRIFFWGSADQKMDFTTLDNTAEYTAEVAMEDSSPRWLMIAGDVASMRDIKNIAEEVHKEKFKFLKPGGLGSFRLVIKLTKFFAPSKDEVFPAWQGMQYLHDMLTGLPKFKTVDNDRHGNIEWTPIIEIVSSNP
jgi:uncharacterized protein YbjT (DUF2867 family)